MIKLVRQNIGQQIRSETLQLIEGWIKEAKEKGQYDRDVIRRRILVYIGAKESKADEYLRILGE